MKFAACTMCKDEEHNVKKWLKRTKDFDYRVVVDTGSTDKTVKLFSKSDVIFDIHVFDPFKFDECRNYVMSEVPDDTDWLFWPDMDEEYEKGWRKEMEKTIKKTPDVTRVLHKSIHYRDGVCEGGSESGTGMDSKIHKHKYYKWIKPIHEYLEPLGEEVVVLNENIVRQHYHINRPEVNELCYEIAKLAAKEHPDDDWNIWFALHDAFKRQLVDDILKYGNMYLNLTRPYTDYRSLAHMYIGQALAQKEGLSKNVMVSMLRAVAENPDNTQAWAFYNHVSSQGRNNAGKK